MIQPMVMIKDSTLKLREKFLERTADDYAALLSNLKKIRKQKRIKQFVAADAIGQERTNYTKREQGKTPITK